VGERVGHQVRVGELKKRRDCRLLVAGGRDPGRDSAERSEQRLIGREKERLPARTAQVVSSSAPVAISSATFSML
jgi:hypothetical protein